MARTTSRIRTHSQSAWVVIVAARGSGRRRGSRSSGERQPDFTFATQSIEQRWCHRARSAAGVVAISPRTVAVSTGCLASFQVSSQAYVARPCTSPSAAR